MEQAFLRIGWYTQGTDCLGPDSRFAIWVQGCRKRCKGCIAQSLQSFDGGQAISVAELAEEILKSGTDGLTISGGEPFLQADAIAILLEKVKSARHELGVIIYSGMKYEELLEDSSAQKVLDYTDLLIDGEYIQELDDNRAMRGSSNQRMIFLSSRYTAEDMPEKRKNKLIFYDDKFRMIGIPTEETKRAMSLLRKQRED